MKGKSIVLPDILDVHCERVFFTLSNWAVMPFVELSKTGRENFIWGGAVRTSRGLLLKCYVKNLGFRGDNLGIFHQIDGI